MIISELKLMRFDINLEYLEISCQGKMVFNDARVSKLYIVWLAQYIGGRLLS